MTKQLLSEMIEIDDEKDFVFIGDFPYRRDCFEALMRTDGPWFRITQGKVGEYVVAELKPYESVEAISSEFQAEISRLKQCLFESENQKQRMCKSFERKLKAAQSPMVEKSFAALARGLHTKLSSLLLGYDEARKLKQSSKKPAAKGASKKSRPRK